MNSRSNPRRCSAGQTANKFMRTTAVVGSTRASGMDEQLQNCITSGGQAVNIIAIWDSKALLVEKESAPQGNK
jgi:hypothetical protein